MVKIGTILVVIMVVLGFVVFWYCSRNPAPVYTSVAYAARAIPAGKTIEGADIGEATINEEDAPLGFVSSRRDSVGRVCIGPSIVKHQLLIKLASKMGYSGATMAGQPLLIDRYNGVNFVDVEQKDKRE